MTSNRTPTRRYDAVDRRREAALHRLGRFPFTTEAAHVAGLTRSDLRSDAVTPVLRGVYVAGTRPVTSELRCAAALALTPTGTRLAGTSAARLWGLPVPDSSSVQVALPPGARIRDGEVTVVRPSVDGCEMLWIRELGLHVPVTPMVALVAESLDFLGLVDAVVLADAIRLRGGTPVDTLPPGRGNSRQRSLLRRVVSLSDDGADSAMESRTRVLLTLAGLTGMVSQYPVVVGGRQRRIDLAFPEARVAIEYDGSHHFVSDEQRQADILRAEDLRAAGWIVIHLVAKDVYGDPAGTIDRVVRALRSRGVDVRVSEEWCRHFSQRTARAA